MMLTELHIEAIEAMGGSMEELTKHLAENPDETWEDYMDDLEYAREAQAR